MRFQEAKEKLESMIGERYSHISYKLTFCNKYNPPLVESQCEVYVEGFGIIFAPTWEKVFDQLNSVMEGRKPPKTEEIPEI
jgi:hypothetical protein